VRGGANDFAPITLAALWLIPSVTSDLLQDAAPGGQVGLVGGGWLRHPVGGVGGLVPGWPSPWGLGLGAVLYSNFSKSLAAAFEYGFCTASTGKFVTHFQTSGSFNNSVIVDWEHIVYMRQSKQ